MGGWDILVLQPNPSKVSCPFLNKDSLWIYFCHEVVKYSYSQVVIKIHQKAQISKMGVV